jgi:hypothetical protein
MTTGGFIPVEIEIEDNFRYALVAVVVDNELVYPEILELRKKHAINKPYGTVLDWVKKVGKNEETSLQNEIRSFREVLQLSPQYDDVILKAVVCNKVMDIDFTTTYLQSFFHHSPSGNLSLKHSIIITPESTFNEVKQVFSQYKKAINDSRKVKSGSQVTYEFIPVLPPLILPDTKQEIKRDRKWYWEYKNGKKPLEIARSSNERGSIETYKFRETVNDALKAYKVLVRNFKKF